MEARVLALKASEYSGENLLHAAVRANAWGMAWSLGRALGLAQNLAGVADSLLCWGAFRILRWDGALGDLLRAG